jgi:hypothetical protein
MRERKGEIPIGYISCAEWTDRRKVKNHTYGKKWFNDGKKSYLLNPQNADDLKVGRRVV